MKVINLWAGPGAGKSTTAAGLFYLMKSGGSRVELVTEFAKELVYDNHTQQLNRQLAVVAEQDNRLRRLEGAVDYAITDSPIPLANLYAKPPYDQRWFYQAVWGVFNTYDNVNFIIKRTKPYVKVGRFQTESEAKDIDHSVRELLALNGTPAFVVSGDKHAANKIIRQIESDEYSSAIQSDNRERELASIREAQAHHSALGSEASYFGAQGLNASSGESAVVESQ